MGDPFQPIAPFFSIDVWCLVFFLTAWLVSYVSFPVIIKISKIKELVATPSNRSSHTTKVPNLGGVGIFMGFVIAFTTFGSLFQIDASYNLIGALVILFFLGLKDDLLILSAKTKLIVQVFVSVLITLNSGVTLSNLYGIFGIYHIGAIPALLLTSFLYVLLINSYNLIDGIDGLAATIAICFLSASSFIFYFAHSTTLLVISLTMLGSVIAFLQYNFSRKKKIFMGDTGSMIIGFLISFLVLHMLQLPEIQVGFFAYPMNPMLVVALLFYPLLDTARIFFVRLILHRTSPFTADKNHIHHGFLKLGFKHYQISIFVGGVTLFLVFLSMLLSDKSIYFQLFMLLFVGSLLFLFPLTMNQLKRINFSLFKDSILIYLVALTALLVQSCASKKDILYFQDGTTAVIADTRIAQQNIEPNDILAVKIYSLDPEAAKVYNIDLLETNGTVNGIEIIKLRSYLVSDAGEITMPVLGKIPVSTMSPTGLEEFLRKKLIAEDHLKEPTVTVRVLNSKITILGEVRSPGTYTFTEKNLTLLQALGLAGDLTINGERKDVLLIRNENATKTIHHVNLTTREWMNSDLYYIKQNDVIVVNPNFAKVKSSGIIGNAGTVLSLISFLLTVFLLLKK